MSVEILLKGVTPTIGEGPHWDDRTQSLLFVDLISKTVYKWDSESGGLESKTFGKFLCYAIFAFVLVLLCKKYLSLLYKILKSLYVNLTMPQRH